VSYSVTTEHQRAIDANMTASENRSRLDFKRQQDQLALDQDRADLSLAVDRGEDTEQLTKNYRMAQRELERTKTRYNEAQIQSDEAAAQLDKYSNAESEYLEAAETSWHHWLLAGVRLFFILGMLIGSLSLTQKMRRKDSRYVPLGLALTASTAILSLVFVTDYITDFINILELGPIVLSLLGAAVTIFFFVVLQKHLAKRAVRVRLRKNECCECAFPVQDGQAYCGNCGIATHAKCEACEFSIRLGAKYCNRCGILQTN